MGIRPLIKIHFMSFENETNGINHVANIKMSGSNEIIVSTFKGVLV